MQDANNWEKESLKRQLKKMEEENKKQKETLDKNNEIVNQCIKDNEKMKNENEYIKKELKYSLISQLQKAKLELEARDEEEKKLKDLVTQLTKDKKTLEHQITVNLEMFQAENKKRDEDIEFLLLAFSEMKNREAKEFDFVYNSLYDLSDKFSKQNGK